MRHDAECPDSPAGRGDGHFPCPPGGRHGGATSRPSGPSPDGPGCRFLVLIGAAIRSPGAPERKEYNDASPSYGRRRRCGPRSGPALGPGPGNRVPARRGRGDGRIPLRVGESPARAGARTPETRGGAPRPGPAAQGCGTERPRGAPRHRCRDRSVAAGPVGATGGTAERRRGGEPQRRPGAAGAPRVRAPAPERRSAGGGNQATAAGGPGTATEHGTTARRRGGPGEPGTGATP